PVDVSVDVRRAGRANVGQGLTTFALVGPTVIALAIFFLAPLWYIFEFSTGLKYFAPAKPLALINGELTAFSGSLWESFLGKGVDVIVMPNIGSGASVTVPSIVIGIGFIVLVTLAVTGNRLGRWGGVVVLGAFLLLLSPFLTLPLGNN